MTPTEAAETPLDPDRLRGLLDECRYGRRLEHHATVGSTNDRARELGRSGAPHGTTVIAECQTRGRGRRGRTWESASQAGLYLSVLLRPSEPDAGRVAALQLAAGIAVVEALGPLLPRRLELLWPNDCLADGAKLAGVLVEGESGADGLDFLVCGIGVNVNQAAGDFPSSLRGVATSVRMLAGAPVDRTQLLARLLAALEAWEDVALRAGPAAITSRWEELSPSARDHDVELETVDGRLRGTSTGLGPSGGLCVRVQGEIREVVLGELIRVRRISGRGPGERARET